MAFLSPNNDDHDQYLKVPEPNGGYLSCGCNSDQSFTTLISEAKPAQIQFNECDVEISNKNNTNRSYLFVYELKFNCEKTRNNDKKDVLSCFTKSTKTGNLILATSSGIIGAISLTNKSISKWNGIYYGKNENTLITAQNECYENGTKVLIDMCLDETTSDTDSQTHFIILTKFLIRNDDNNNNNNSNGNGNNCNCFDYKIEIYKYNDRSNELNLTRILNIPSACFEDKIFEFVRIYYDEFDNAYIILDSNNHKIYWISSITSQLKRCIKSPSGDSIESPTGLIMFKDPDIDYKKTIYICNKKGLLICREGHLPVKHDQLIVNDITYCNDEEAIYFIDDRSLYRSKLSEATITEQRYKRVFSHKLGDKKQFKRVIACKDQIFLIGSETNTLYAFDRDYLQSKLT